MRIFAANFEKIGKYFMKNYEVTFIVDPVLSGDEIKQAAQTYQDMLVKEQCNIVHVERMGLRQLAYPINRRSSGIYFCVEFEAPSGHFIPKMDLSFRRDERIMRFLTVKLDRYGCLLYTSPSPRDS